MRRDTSVIVTGNGCCCGLSYALFLLESFMLAIKFQCSDDIGEMRQQMGT